MTLSGPSAVALEQARGPSAVATSLTFKIMYKIDRRGGGSKNRSLGNYFIPKGIMGVFSSELPFKSCWPDLQQLLFVSHWPEI